MIRQALLYYVVIELVSGEGCLFGFGSGKEFLGVLGIRAALILDLGGSKDQCRETTHNQILLHASAMENSK